MNPLVSVITPCYNAEKFIAQTIESVIAQTYSSWEMIVVDDCSTDKSVLQINALQAKDNRIQLIQLNENNGAAVCRNTAIEKAKGKYIAFLDSDDLWQPRKLAVQVAFMEQHKYALSYTSYQKINELGEQYQKGLVKASSKLDYKAMLTANRIGCLTAMYNAEQLGKIYMPLVRKRQDYGLWLKILKRIPYAYGIEESLALYRIRENSISSSKFEMVYWNWKLFKDIEQMSYIEAFMVLLNNIFFKMKSNS